MGWRPRVRGVAKNPIDHPMGGGEGKSSGGRHPVLAVGLEDQGLQDQKAQGLRQVHREKKEIGGTLENASFS